MKCSYALNRASQGRIFEVKPILVRSDWDLVYLLTSQNKDLWKAELEKERLCYYLVEALILENGLEIVSSKE